MANVKSIKVATALPVTIGRNGIGHITLEDYETLQGFALQNSNHLASMLHVLWQSHVDIDPGFMEDMLEMANDLAYQVQQAVKLMATENVAGGASNV